MYVKSFTTNATERHRIGPPAQDDASERSRICPTSPDDATERSRICPISPNDATYRSQIGPTAPDDATEHSRISPTAPDDGTERKRFGHENTTKRRRIGPPTPDETMKLRCVGASAPDGGWGLVIVIRATVLNFLIGGAVNSFGVIYLLDVFQESSGKTAWVGSMANTMGLLLGPVSSALSSRFFCQTMVVVGGVLTAAGWTLTSLMPRLEYMFLIYGLLAGIGKSLAYTPSIVILGQSFRRLHSLATGIAVAGAGIGTFAFAPLLEMLFKHVEFKCTMFIMAGVMVNIIICGLFFRDVPNDKSALTINEGKERANDIYCIETVTNEQSRNESDYCDKEDTQRKNANEQSRNESDFFDEKGFREYLDYTLLKRSLFLCFGVSIMSAACGHTPATVMIPPLAIEHYVTPQRAAFLLSITGIADIVGRLAFGFLCDIELLRNSRKYFYTTAIFISGIANITSGFSSQYWQFATYSVIFGLFAGSYNALDP
ncbi:LOW QUALITY PROTEIN: MOT12-like protein [Mya arenaria]|uniref:MOT12-like protein n=1 Tax=Mya arenaria TaxID=6604 RepID=A0ABY7EC95_MYAAR|nr:LOW QUALITY PROTEIN: MOT12-like protein [Mya arenaria]